jgi:hypothetical protein
MGEQSDYSQEVLQPVHTLPQNAAPRLRRRILARGVVRIEKATGLDGIVQPRPWSYFIKTILRV